MKSLLNKELFCIDSEDGVKIQCYRWSYKATAYTNTCILVHGMGDHAQRYEGLAEFLCKNGISVLALDLRGHGRTAEKNPPLGHLADKYGWEKSVKDIKSLVDISKNKIGQRKIFLFGHSMGEMMIRDLILEHSDIVDGVMLAGVAANPGIVKVIGKLTSSLISFFKGKRHKSILLTKMLFGKYNSTFSNTRTAFDWISSINHEVDKYISDRYCNIIFTSGFFQDLNRGFERINKVSNIKNIKKDLPVYILSGMEDAVGNKSKGALEIRDLFKQQGIRDVECKLYEGVRHEIINDVSRQQSYNDIKNWIEQHS